MLSFDSKPSLNFAHICHNLLCFPFVFPTGNEPKCHGFPVSTCDFRFARIWTCMSLSLAGLLVPVPCSIHCSWGASPLMQRVSGMEIHLNLCHFYYRVERASSQAAGRRSAVAVPSVSALPARTLPSLDVLLPSNQDMEVVNVKGAVMKNALSSLKSCQKL